MKKRPEMFLKKREKTRKTIIGLEIKMIKKSFSDDDSWALIDLTLGIYINSSCN